MEEQNTHYRNYIEDELERIKSENPNMYLNRSDLLQLMRIPKSSKGLVVVKCNNQGTGFRRDAYVRELCGDYVSKDEFRIVVDHCSFLMKKLYSKKRSADAMKTPLGVKLVYLASASML